MAKKEFAVGERFQCGLVTLECVEESTCKRCFFDQCECFGNFSSIIGECDKTRSDHKNVIFKQVKDNDNE